MKTTFNFAEIPLSDLATGEKGIVHHVDDADPIGKRLLDMGFIPLTPIRVVRRAPLGDPVEFELRGYRLCLRRSEASRIVVKRAL